MLQDLSSPFIEWVQQCKVLVSLLFLLTNHCPGSNGLQNIYILWFLSVRKFQGKSTHFWWVGKGIQEKGRGDTGVPKDKFTCIPASLWASHVHAWQPGELSWGGKGAKGGNTSLHTSFLERLYQEPAKLLARSKAAANTGKKCSGASEGAPAVDCSQSFILGWVVRATEGPARRASHTQRGRQFSLPTLLTLTTVPLLPRVCARLGKAKLELLQTVPIPDSEVICCSDIFQPEIASLSCGGITCTCTHVPTHPCAHAHAHTPPLPHTANAISLNWTNVLWVWVRVKEHPQMLCTWSLPLLWWDWMLVRKDPRCSTLSSSSFSELCDSKFSANCKENFSKIPKLKGIYEALYCMWYTKTLLPLTEHAHACKCTHVNEHVNAHMCVCTHTHQFILLYLFFPVKIETQETGLRKVCIQWLFVLWRKGENWAD